MKEQTVSRSDISEFKAFCKGATDSQLDYICERERQHDRVVYVALAEAEMERRRA